MRIKFNRLKLVNALKKSREQALAQFKKDTQDFHRELEKARKKHTDNVRAYLKHLESGGENEDGSDIRSVLYKDTDWPSKPKQPQMATVDNVIQILELTDTDVVECNTKEQYVELTRACAILGTCKI